MYFQMPGLPIGLVCGWIYDRATHGASPFNPTILVVGLTILVNAFVYYLIFNLLLFFRTKYKK
jgi:sugar phosphate permease